MGRKFNIVASCDFPFLWRYNLLLVCEMCDAAGERIDFAYEERRLGDVGCRMSEPPAGWKSGDLVLESCECERVRVLLYVNPHTLPTSRDVESLPPFEIRVTVSDANVTLYSKVHYVDQRGGAAISVEV